MIRMVEDSDLLYGDIIGRMPVGGSGDESDFDALPRNEIDITSQDVEMSNIFAGDDPEPFESPPPEQFPVFKAALRHFHKKEESPKAVRIDTDATYDDFVCERAVEELARQVDALREELHAHEMDPNAHHRTTVLGAAQAITDLRSAENADDAVKAMPPVPLDLPPFAEGKVRCWRSGDTVVCSLRFGTPDGEPRVATMAARPSADADEAARWAIMAGCDPTTVLGVLPDLAATACGKRLVRDTARAALKAQERDDVRGMSAPVVLGSVGNSGRAPLAALMYVKQKAHGGDAQAQRELNKIARAARTPAGRQIVQPALDEADRRLAGGRPSFFQRLLSAVGVGR